MRTDESHENNQTSPIKLDSSGLGWDRLPTKKEQEEILNQMFSNRTEYEHENKMLFSQERKKHRFKYSNKPKRKNENKARAKF